MTCFVCNFCVNSLKRSILKGIAFVKKACFPRDVTLSGYGVTSFKYCLCLHCVRQRRRQQEHGEQQAAADPAGGRGPRAARAGGLGAARRARAARAGPRARAAVGPRRAPPAPGQAQRRLAHRHR